MGESERATLFSGLLTGAASGVVAQVKESLVSVHDGRRGAGAGVVWRSDGIVLTNHHVIAGGRTHITLADDRQFPARLLASDPELDLAVLRIEAIGLPTAAIADSRHLRIGELVFAVGNPWGQRGVVTAGIISGLGEVQVRGPRGKAEYIRTDARLAPGNSGGPLVNASGAVVGINAMIVGGDLGVAIPSHTASQFLAEALGRQVMLGVGVQAVPLAAGTPGAAEGQTRGLLVVELAGNGPASRAGVLVGDILVALNGSPLDEPRTLVRTLLNRQPGERVDLALLRGGQPHRLQAELDLLERAA